MITSFRVQNYKCLEDVTIPLTPIHVLIGQNDTGKTSVLEALKASCELYSFFQKPRRSVRQTSFPTVGSPQFDTFLVRYFSKIGEYFRKKMRRFELCFKLPTNESASRAHFMSEISIQMEQDKVEFYDLPQSAPDIINTQLIKLNPKIMSRPATLNMSPTVKLEEDGFGLPALLDNIKDSNIDGFVALQSKFREYLPHYQKIKLVNTQGWVRTEDQSVVVFGKNENQIGKSVVLTLKDGEINLEQASDGAVILLGILAMIYSSNSPDLLLIEEPENGIHPTRLVEIAKLLREFTQREANAPQIILTTHSPYLLSEFQPEEVTLMRRVDGVVKAFPLRDAKRIRERMGGGEFYLGELWYNLDEEDLLK